MLSRLGYLGAFLNPDPAQLDEIKDLIYRFVKSKLNISKERVTAPIDLGWLGMIDIDDYLVSLKCSWIRRAGINKDDLWSFCLNLLYYTEPDGQRHPALDTERFAVLSAITDESNKFCLASLLSDNKILESKIEYNLIFCNSQHGDRLQESVFEQVLDNLDRRMLGNLMVGEVLHEGAIYPLDELNNKLGFELHFNTYNTLLRGIRELKSKNILVL
jgi:hypothetical protein